MEQAVRDNFMSDRQAFPTVFHKKNNEKLMVTMRFDDWINLYDSYYSDMKLREMSERNEIISKVKEENGL